MNKTYVLHCADVIKLFQEETQGLPLGEHDARNVALQVFFILLNLGSLGSEDFNRLPILEDLRHPEKFEDDPAALAKLQQASYTLAMRIYNRLQALKVFVDEGICSDPSVDFPFYFGRWHGNDAILDLMPY